MKKFMLLVLAIPSLVCAQSITNTLGASGEFVVENNTNLDIVYIKPGNVTGRELIFGQQPSSFAEANLPSGYSVFFRNLAQIEFTLTNAASGATTAPIFSLTRANGNFTGGILAVGANDYLGVIQFNGRATSAYDYGAATIRSVATAISSNDISANLQFVTTNVTTTNTMTYTELGNLNVPGSVSAAAIASKSANYSATTSDEVIVCTDALTITLPSVASVPVGKTYTIKKGTNSNVTITINTTSSQNIDDVTTTSLSGNNVTPYITLKSDGTQWWVVAQGSGI